MMRPTFPPPRGLYLITPDSADDGSLVRRSAGLLGAGVRLLQYRNKTASRAQRRAESTALLELCRQQRILFVVNDDVDLAVQIGADGVHLGEDDGDPREVRQRLGERAVVGVSCYDSRQRVDDAVAAGASYVALGAFYPTTSKSTARRADIALLREVAALGVPTVAIGGITPDNADPLIAAGATWVAAIGAVYAAANPQDAALAFAQLFHSNPTQEPQP